MTIVKKIASRFSDYPVFTYRDVRLYLGPAYSPGNLARILSYMKSSGAIYSPRKGVYTFRNDDMVSGFAYSPFYYGLLSALHIRELWTQSSRPEIITMKKVRTSKTHVFGSAERTIFVHHIPARYFFGFDILTYGKMKLPVSDPEKTLIDLFYYKVRLPIQDYGGLLKAVRMKKLSTYLKVYDNHTSVAVLAFARKYKKAADSGKLSNPY